MRATEILSSEHRQIERGLRVLEVMAARVRAAEVVAEDDLRAVLRFIREYADAAHHEKEERLLFPALARAGMPAQGGPVAVMLHEHEEGRALVAKLVTAVDAGVAGSHFADDAGAFIELLRHHIQKEDQVLFQMAQNLITDSTSLDASFDEALAVQQESSATLLALLDDLERRFL